MSEQNVRGDIEGAVEMDQPSPIYSEHPAVWPLVITDMLKRDAFGEGKYGTRLRPHNGRDALLDAYQEALDLCVYLRQSLYERELSRRRADS